MHKSLLEWIYPGPGLKLLKQPPPLLGNQVRIFEDGQAVSVLKELVDHWLMRKFAGPFGWQVTHINHRKLQYLPIFCVPKDDGTIEDPKNRVILNAAHVHSLSAEELDFLEKLDLSNDSDFKAFKNTVFLRSLNDNLADMKISFTRIHEIIEGIYKSKLLFKMDLSKGFRNIVRKEDS